MKLHKVKYEKYTLYAFLESISIKLLMIEIYVILDCSSHKNHLFPNIDKNSQNSDKRCHTFQNNTLWLYLAIRFLKSYRNEVMLLLQATLASGMVVHTFVLLIKYHILLYIIISMANIFDNMINNIYVYIPT
jgi:hypothetical protein